MKKISIGVLSLMALGLLTGCGDATKENKDDSVKEQKLVCTSTQEENGMSIDQIISMDFEDDKLNHMTMEVNTTVTNSDIQKNWDNFKEIMSESNKEFSKDGISQKIDVDDKNYKYNISIDVDLKNASEETLKEYDFDDLIGDNSTLEENKEEAESTGYTCKVE